jgi:DNA (cytosine-5)-methyltransferase 3A
MNVLSLFDGMSCGQIALERAGIKVDNYFASEIKKHAIMVTQDNYPDTVQIGDVCEVKAKDLPKIDLIIGGSPCQDFSQANMNRDGLSGEKSKLFFEYLRILNEVRDINPDVKFLLENVVMEAEQESIVSNYMGITPVRINSELVSPQLRDRLYWTNICDITTDLFGGLVSNIKQPDNKKIFLQDILEGAYTERAKAKALLESDSRPLKSQDKIWRRYNLIGFTTIVFESPDLDWRKGVRYLNQNELEKCQTVPPGYTKILNRNKAACLLGDGWTVDVIVHILKQGELK